MYNYVSNYSRNVSCSWKLLQTFCAPHESSCKNDFMFQILSYEPLIFVPMVTSKIVRFLVSPLWCCKKQKELFIAGIYHKKAAKKFQYHHIVVLTSHYGEATIDTKEYRRGFRKFGYIFENKSHFHKSKEFLLLRVW